MLLSFLSYEIYVAAEIIMTLSIFLRHMIVQRSLCRPLKDPQPIAARSCVSVVSERSSTISTRLQRSKVFEQLIGRQSYNPSRQRGRVSNERYSIVLLLEVDGRFK